MTKSPYEILIRPLVTEDSTLRAESAKPRYTFEVHPAATKPEIRWAIETVFNVKVTSVRTLLVKGKVKRVRFREGRRPDRKKAIISLAPDQKLDIY
jgi:large subunit ribosomal protein L23